MHSAADAQGQRVADSSALSLVPGGLASALVDQVATDVPYTDPSGQRRSGDDTFEWLGWDLKPFFLLRHLPKVQQSGLGS